MLASFYFSITGNPQQTFLATVKNFSAKKTRTRIMHK